MNLKFKILLLFAILVAGAVLIKPVFACRKQACGDNNNNIHVSPTLTPTLTPTPEPSATPSPTVTPEVTPEPTKTPEVKTENKGTSPASAPVCIADELKYAPTVLSAIKRGDCVTVEWSLTDADRYTLYVAPSGQNPQDFWNDRDIKGQSDVFCELPAGAVDVQVCGLNICGAPKCSTIFEDDVL